MRVPSHEFAALVASGDVKFRPGGPVFLSSTVGAHRSRSAAIARRLRSTAIAHRFRGPVPGAAAVTREQEKSAGTPLPDGAPLEVDLMNGWVFVLPVDAEPYRQPFKEPDRQ